MKPINALLEIGCEEIPARFARDMINDLKKKTEEKLLASNLSYKSVETFGTPRRLALIIEGLPNKQPDVQDEIKGPPAEIAFDRDGNHTQAAQGFARKNGVSLNKLHLKTEGNRNFLYASILRKGQLTEKLLAALFPEIISSLYLPISMKWGSEEFKFIRPIHWIVALCGSKVVNFQLAGIKSSNKSAGHRFSNIPITQIPDPNKVKYLSVLKKKDVIIDQNERKELIRGLVKKAAPQALIDEALLEEVTYLVEKPFALVCSFKPEYLNLPKDVLITTMKKNQKYFPVLDEMSEPATKRRGSLISKFVVVTNNCRNKCVKEGNQRVISARLSDAKFFFDEDRKMPLKMRVPDLKKVQFFEGLGDMEQKTERMMKLSGFIAKQLKIDPLKLPLIERTAQLAKADLTTQMVFEFPELQGVMGREYALLSQEDKVVADGIFEHYLPRHSEDIFPKTITGTVVSLADKIDTIVGCFGIDKIPSGSQDPYGLRRAAYGIIKIIIANKLEIQLNEVLSYAFMGYGDILNDTKFNKVYKEILEFIGIRLKALLLEDGITHDVIDASLANLSDILYSYDISKVLQKLKPEPWFLPLMKTHERAQRISASAVREQVIEHDLTEEVEKKLFEIYLKVNWDVEEKLNAGNYSQAIIELSKLTEPVELFFEKVLVMHNDERIKTNRLALLKTINSLFLKVADIKKVVV